jgi:hypothetical protein
VRATVLKTPTLLQSSASSLVKTLTATHRCASGDGRDEIRQGPSHLRDTSHRISGPLRRHNHGVSQHVDRCTAFELLPVTCDLLSARREPD